MEFAPGGRLFVAEQRGTLRAVKAGGKLATFLDISGRVDSAGERGLLGVAFDPAFSKNRYVYLYYTQRATSTTPAHNRVIRVRARGDRAVAGTKKLILRLNNLSSATNHNGGPYTSVRMASSMWLWVTTPTARTRNPWAT